jgi:hypothetical protein
MPATASRTTLGDLQRSSPWIWLNCERCQHYAALAYAVPVIRWGAQVSSDKSTCVDRGLGRGFPVANGRVTLAGAFFEALAVQDFYLAARVLDQT